MTKHLGLHETLDLHEMLTVKSLSLTKATTMSMLAQDAALKTILADEAVTGNRHIQEIQRFITERSDNR